MRRTVRLALAVLIGLLFSSIFLAESALHIPEHPQPSLPYARAFARTMGAGVESVQLRAADSALLDAWLFTPARPNGAAVIVLHGIGDTRTGVLGHAKFLLASGYTVLTPDSRAHGASGGPLVTYGVLESGDVHRWADLLLHRPGITRLYGAGQSMGAAILIQSLSCGSLFRAIAADCPFATFEQIAYDRLAQRGFGGRLVSAPVIGLGMFYARVRYGIDLRQASPAAALAKTQTPVLLIHGSADTNIPPRHSRQLHALNLTATELWIVPAAEHVESIGREPAEYARRVLAFFAAH
jgi:uncharacterized protein